MKKLLVLTLALTLPLAQVVRADDDTDKKKTQTPGRSRGGTALPAGRAIPTKGRGPAGQAAGSAGATWSSANPTHWGQVTALRGPGATPAREKRGRPKRTESRARRKRRTKAKNQNRHVDRNSFTVARSRAVHGHHDRNWWRRHYKTRFVLFGGGYYYWNLGYWYPAFGYSPFYNNYAYSEPIYGYNNLAP